MSFADLLPVRISLFDRTVPRTRHRAIDKADRLEFLLAGANALIKGLRLQLDDMHYEHEQIIARIDERHGEIVRGLEQQIADLEHRLNVGVLAESVVTRTQELSLDEIRQHCVIPLNQSPMAAVTDPGHAFGEGAA